MKKKHIYIIITLIVLILTVLAFTSYALWQQTKKQTNHNKVGTACLNISFSDENSEDINIEDMWPTTDKEGSMLMPYTFTVTNNCEKTVRYTIALESVDGENTNYLDDANIKIKLNNESPVIYKDLEDEVNDTEVSYTIRNTKKITTRRLAGKESVTHNLRIWLDENAPITEMNKYFYSKIKIIAGQNIGEELYDYTPEEYFTVNAQGQLTNYNFEGGDIVVIPPTVNGIKITSIGSNAFGNGKDISYLDMSDMNYLTTINRDSFYLYVGTDNSLELPNNVDSVGYRAFRDFKGSSLKLNENLTTIADYAFMSYVGTGDTLIIPDGVTTIGSNAFNAFKGDKLVLNDNLTTIGNSAFKSYVGTNQDLIIPSSVTTLWDRAFNSFNGNNIVFNDTIQTIPSFCFSAYVGNGKELIIPSNITSIGDSAFLNFNGKSLTLSNNITSIGNYSFQEYKGLNTNLVIPNPVTRIGARAFFKYVGNSITFNSNLSTLGGGAFSNYNGADLTLPSSLVTLESWNVYSTFLSMTGNITVTASDTSGYIEGWAPKANIIYANQ